MLQNQKYLSTVISVSLVIMIYQGVANSDLGVISQFTHQKNNNWAGPLSTALLFTGSGLGSLYNKYIGKYPYRLCLFFGSFGYTIFIAMGLIFIKVGFSSGVMAMIFLGSLVGGLIVSVFYNAQFNYINVLSKIDGKQVKYFGINMGMVQASNFFGATISSLLIRPLGQFYYVLTMDIIALMASFGLLFCVKEPETTETQPNEQYQQAQQTSDALAVIPAHYCGPCFAFTGIIISFVYTALSIIIYRTFGDKMSDEQLNHLTFVIFIFEGLGQLLGGLAMVFFSRRITNIPKAYLCISTLFVLSVLIVYLGSIYESKVLIGIGAFITGFCDCSSMVVALTLAGNWRTSGITAYNIWQCMTVATSVMFMVFVKFEYFLIWIGIFFIACWFSLVYYLKKIESAKESQPLMPSVLTEPETSPQR